MHQVKWQDGCTHGGVLSVTGEAGEGSEAHLVSHRHKVSSVVGIMQPPLIGINASMIGTPCLGVVVVPWNFPA